jgi:hypothetical protein
VEEGLALLVHGSPIGNAETLGDDADDDVGLLDYNSDNSAHEAPPIPRHAASAGDLYQLATAHSAMETDPPRDCPSLQRNNSGSDTLTTYAVHFQCRSARESSHRDHLVSVARQNVWGKKFTVQSLQMGTLEDHGHINSACHGSRVMKGNVIVNQSISCSFDPAKSTALVKKRSFSL